MKVIVIGGSHGGYESVETIYETMPKNTVVNWYDQGDLDLVVNWSKERVDDAKDVRHMTNEALNKNHINLFSFSKVINIDASKHCIIAKNLVTDEEIVDYYDKLIIATGSDANKLRIPGTNLDRVMTMRGKVGINKVKQQLHNAQIKNVIIVGGGYIGIMAANMFSQAGKQVTLINGSQQILDNYLDDDFIEILMNDLKNHQVNLELSQQVIRINGDTTVASVETNKGEYLADMVLLAVGNKPNTEWLDGIVKLNSKKLIEVDEYMHTDLEDVFAVGDATEVRFTPTNEMKNIALASNAQRQAKTAVANLNSNLQPFYGVQGTSGLVLFDKVFATTGVNSKMIESAGLPISSVLVTYDNLMDNVPDNFRTQIRFKLFYSDVDHTIKGAQILADKDFNEIINTISVAIQMRMTIEQLAYADFYFQPQLTNEWNIMNIAAQKALKKTSND